MRGKSILVLVATGAMTLALAGTAGAAPAGPHRQVLPGSVPGWAAAAYREASTPAGERLDFRVYLPWRGGGSAAAEALAVSTPGTAEYGKFLTPQQFRKEFSPTATDAHGVEKWLTGQGFSVGYVPTNRKYIEATGTVAQAQTAFGTSFSQYAVDGMSLRANNSPLSVPAGLPAIEGVVGLDDSAALIRPTTSQAPPPGVFVNARPCGTYWGQATIAGSPTLGGTTLPAYPPDWAPCGYAGAQLQGAYGMSGAIAAGNNGAGVTVAIIDAYASPTIASDLATYSARHGLPPATGLFHQMVAPGTYNRPENHAQDPQGWSGEETLDVEAVHTMAPGAKILYVSAPNNYQDLDAALNTVVNKHLADIVTNSYGFASESLPRGYIKPLNDILVEAAATGISVFFSSGDNGDETNGVPGATPTPDWPASSPWVTAVGGTSMGVGADNNRLFGLGWETTRSTLGKNGTWGTPAWLYGSGGGTSRLFAQPAYQAGVVPASMSEVYGGAPMRVVPDVAALADPNTGMLIGQTQTFPDGHAAYSEYRIGGTSLASPLYAGMFALAVQKAGHGFGLANPVLYRTRAASTDITKDALASYPGDVRADYVNGVDATAGYTYSVRWFDRDAALTIHVAPGYDDVTGLGAPNGPTWLAAVAGS